MTTSEFPVYARRDIEIIGGNGIEARTADGRILIDFYGGHAALVLGLGHPSILKALKQQSERVFFQTNLVESTARKNAEQALANFAPDGLDRVFLVNSGAEANENALRLALRRGEGQQVIALEGGFHGRTAAAAACTHRATERWYGFPRTPFDVNFVPPNDTAALRDAIRNDTAAFIFEPVQGMGGALVLDTDYLQAARELTLSHNALMIADEVQCGMGRTGKNFAVEWSGVTPDIITSAKSLAAGFPAGAVIAQASLADDLDIGTLGTTFGGGPMASALISTVIREITPLIENVSALEEQIRATCCVGPVKSIRGRGLLLGLELTRAAKEVTLELEERGFLLGGSAVPNIARIMPPLILTADHIDSLAAALSELPS